MMHRDLEDLYVGGFKPKNPPAHQDKPLHYNSHIEGLCLGVLLALFF